MSSKRRRNMRCDKQEAANKGIELFWKGEYRSALGYLMQGAKKNKPICQNLLGYCLQQGHGIRRNARLSRKWYSLAAEAGNADALYNLALSYEQGIGGKRDLDKARRYYEKAARAGVIEAQCNLGTLYLDRGCGSQDIAKGLLWLRTAAKSGDIKAQYNLGCAYMSYVDGNGACRWGRYWLRKAAKQGHKGAIKRLRGGGGNSPYSINEVTR